MGFGLIMLLWLYGLGGEGAAGLSLLVVPLKNHPGVDMRPAESARTDQRGHDVHRA